MNGDILLFNVKIETNEGSIDDEIPIEETKLFKEHKSYRLNKSRIDNIKPYLVYNDNQLKALISKMPQSINELIEVNGFSMEKANNYGEEILAILMKY